MKKTNSAIDRINQLKKTQEAAKATKDTDIVNQLAHEDNGEPDFTEIAKKLEAIKAEEARGENDGYVKLTIYIREDIVKSFNALITKRGQQKEFANQAFKDFVQKKARELGL